MSKVVHKVELDGSENQYEGAWIVCDPYEHYDDPKASDTWIGVTCKRCLKRKDDFIIKPIRGET